MRGNEQITNLDELILRCRTDQSKEYIQEAMDCYRAGAFRACIVSTWIALVFDLIDKIRELDLSGNGKATILYKKFETFQGQLRDGSKQGLKNSGEFERNILTEVNKNLEYFSPQEFEDLDRLRKDRHRCAHPSHQSTGIPYRPSAELARLHLRNTIIHVLAQEPIQGKAALEQLINQVTSKFFPMNEKDAEKQLAQSPIHNPSESLINGFIDELLYGYMDPSSPLHRSGKARAALQFMVNNHNEKSVPRISKQIDKITKKVSDDEFVFLIILIVLVRDVWDSLAGASREKVKQYFRTEEVYKSNSAILKYSHSQSELGAIIDDYINGTSDLEILEKIVEKGLRSRSIIDKAVELYLLSKKHGGTDALLDSKRQLLISPLIESLNKNDIEKIIGSHKDRPSDSLGDSRFRDFLSNLQNSDIINEADLAKLLKDNDLSSQLLLDMESLSLELLKQMSPDQ